MGLYVILTSMFRATWSSYTCEGPSIAFCQTLNIFIAPLFPGESIFDLVGHKTQQEYGSLGLGYGCGYVIFLQCLCFYVALKHRQYFLISVRDISQECDFPPFSKGQIYILPLDGTKSHTEPLILWFRVVAVIFVNFMKSIWDLESVVFLHLKDDEFKTFC